MGNETFTVPRNAVTGQEYQGRNVGRLLEAEVLGGFGPGGWAGFHQWIRAGRVVRKGEHGTACLTVMTDKAEDGRAVSKGVRGFRVFHFDQTTELGADTGEVS